ncbi:MAG: cytochrome c [Flavobacterium sp.]
MKKTVNTRFYLTFMAFLLTVFSLYNFTIYTKENSDYTTILSPKAIEGQTLWQENNCYSCHQLYGLGGYLGPDLTNVFSTKEKGPDYINAYLNSGIKSMPQFNFSEKDKEALVTFLKEVDQSGYYPNHNAQIKPNGWVDIQYKNKNEK